MLIRHNIRKIPDSVLEEIKTSKENSFDVYIQKALKKTDILSGKYKNIGISNVDENLVLKQSFCPNEKTGRFCKYNKTVRIIRHTELPKITRTCYFDVPNWGGNGTHEISRDYKCYPKEYRQPTFIEINIEKIEETNEEVICRFTSSEILSKDNANFKERLFSNLNIFQEIFGSFSLKESSMPYPEYRKQISVSWEFLPEGKREEQLKSFITRNPNTTPEQQKELIERFKFLETFHPIATITGTSGFYRYIGYQLRNNLIIFENLRYGNAIYIMYDDWRNLSRRSRVDLLSGNYGIDFDRIIHNKNWKTRLTRLLTHKGL